MRVEDFVDALPDQQVRRSDDGGAKPPCLLLLCNGLGILRLPHASQVVWPVRPVMSATFNIDCRCYTVPFIHVGDKIRGIIGADPGSVRVDKEMLMGVDDCLPRVFDRFEL